MKPPVESRQKVPQSVLDGAAVKAFLLRPLDRSAFDRFFRICYTHSLGYLRYLKARGFELPLASRADDSSYHDLAIDILGPLLQSSRKQAFTVVFDYFRRAGLADPASADDKEIYRLFTILLRGFIRKELSRIKKQLNPQIDHLKRRFKEILNGPGYDIFRTDGVPGDCVCLVQARQDLRLEKPPIPDAELTMLVEAAYLKARNRAEWCHQVFALLQTDSDWRNAIVKHQLFGIIVAVNLKYSTQDAPRQAALPAAEYGLLCREIKEARDHTLTWLRENVLQRFVEKQRITQDEAVRFEAAFAHYVSDLVHTGESEALPVYFREAMPAGIHDNYLAKYKYVFETAMNEAAQFFKSELQKKTTWLASRAYS